ncbi:MAG: hypothetical protein PVH61_15415 [Candidatus Aminicenantes bacterium]|jgi:hypothetical protein
MKAAATNSVSNDTEKTSHNGLNVGSILTTKNLSAFPTRHPLVQAKLKIGQPNDKYEQEADRVADMVMRMPDSGIQRQSTCPECMEKGGQSGKSGKSGQVFYFFTFRQRAPAPASSSS